MSAVKTGLNISALVAERNLATAQARLRTSSERLASGQRINRAADDAAGLSVASKLNVDSRVYGQAMRNLNDGASLLSVAEGALKELSAISTRQRELATQAANGTYSNTQRIALNKEASALTEEYNRITASVNFNGLSLLDGSMQQLRLQGGYGEITTLDLQLGSQLSCAVTGGASGQGSGAATAEVTRITVPAAASIAAGSYFEISTPSTTYNVWFRKDGAGSAPAVPGTAIMVDLGAAGAAEQAQITFADGAISTSSVLNVSTTAGDFHFWFKEDLADTDPGGGGTAVPIQLSSGAGITSEADVSSVVAGSWLSFSAPEGYYRVWYRVDGAGSDPGSPSPTDAFGNPYLGDFVVDVDGTVIGPAQAEVIQLQFSDGDNYDYFGGDRFTLATPTTQLEFYLDTAGSGGTQIGFDPWAPAWEIGAEAASVINAAFGGAVSVVDNGGGLLTITNNNPGETLGQFSSSGFISVSTVQQGLDELRQDSAEDIASMTAAALNSTGYFNIATNTDYPGQVEVESISPNPATAAYKSSEQLLGEIKAYLDSQGGIAASAVTTDGSGAHWTITSTSQAALQDASAAGLGISVTTTQQGAAGGSSTAEQVGNLIATALQGTGQFTVADPNSAILNITSNAAGSATDAANHGAGMTISTITQGADASGGGGGGTGAAEVRVTAISGYDLTTQSRALSAMAEIDATMQRISLEMGNVGALQSRLSTLLGTVTASRDNYIEAASRITDIDVAAESADMLRAQLTSQVATSILSQANQAPRIALQLLSAA